jgi:SOS-response transcriptional repressor LexA
MNITIGKTLAELRKAKKLMQKDVASKLSAYGIKISSKTIHNWEKELALPNPRQFIALCDIYGVDDILWRFAGIHNGLYAGLNNDGRDKARDFISILFQNDKFRDEPLQVREVPRIYRLYDIPVSAGTGNFLDDSSYEEIEAPDFVPSSADFALRISGDSMKPLFEDGRVVWVKSTQALDSGDIGIFFYSDNAFCKKLIITDRKVFLRSLNSEYEDIEINEDFGFKPIGKVVA